MPYLKPDFCLHKCLPDETRLHIASCFLECRRDFSAQTISFSPLNLHFNQNLFIKWKAFKPAWISSPEREGHISGSDRRRLSEAGENETVVDGDRSDTKREGEKKE